MDKLNRADIHAARGLPDQQHFWIRLDLARQHQLLLIAARKSRDPQPRIRRTNIVTRHLLFTVR
jgi:hypothetical protein